MFVGEQSTMQQIPVAKLLQRWTKRRSQASGVNNKSDARISQARLWKNVSSLNESAGLYPTVSSSQSSLSMSSRPVGNRPWKSKVFLVLESSCRTVYMSSDILRFQGVAGLEPAQVRSRKLGLKNPR